MTMLERDRQPFLSAEMAARAKLEADVVRIAKRIVAIAPPERTDGIRLPGLLYDLAKALAELDAHDAKAGGQT